MRSHLLAFASAAFLLNPNACSSTGADSQYQYGESEMRAAVEGTWDITVTTQQGVTAEFSVLVKQGPAPESMANLNHGAPQHTSTFPLALREAKACGTRTLVATAEACIDSTEMPLTVNFVEGDSRLGDAVIWNADGDETQLSGNFRVDSHVFEQGWLRLKLGTLVLGAQVRNDGTPLSVTLEDPYDAEVSIARREQ